MARSWGDPRKSAARVGAGLAADAAAQLQPPDLPADLPLRPRLPRFARLQIVRAFHWRHGDRPPAAQMVFPNLTTAAEGSNICLLEHLFERVRGKAPRSREGEAVNSTTERRRAGLPAAAARMWAVPGSQRGLARQVGAILFRYLAI